MGIIIGWIIVSVFVALIAKQMNRSGFAWFLASLLISPIIALIALAVVGKTESEHDILNKQKQLQSYKNRVEDFISVYIQNEESNKNNPVLIRLFQQLSNNKNSSTLDELDKALQLMCNNDNPISLPIKEINTTHDDDFSARIKTLIQLHKDELISTDEFEKKKSEILNQI